MYRSFQVKLLLVLFFAFLFSCNEKQTKHKNQKAKKSDQGETIPITEEKTISNSTSIFPRFKVKEFCKAEDQEIVFEEMGKYGKRKAYDLKIDHVNNRLKISYSIIDDCCLKFRGKANIEGDKLNLFHFNRSNELCECKCKYEMYFEITGIDSIPEKININKEPIENLQ